MNEELDGFLSPGDFTKRIRNLNATLTMETILPDWTAFRENQLPAVLPETNNFWAWWLTAERPANKAFEAINEALRRWAVNYIWAQYWLTGDVQHTNAGPVVKRTEWSTPVSVDQRTQLYQQYADIAYAHRNQLIRLLNPSNSCATGPQQGLRRVRVVGRNKGTDFGN